MDVIPAILEQNEAELHKLINMLKNDFNKLHIDIADGALTQSKTLSIEKILTVLELHKEIRFELHLMMKNPQKIVDFLKNQLQLTQIDTVLIHAAADPLQSVFGQQLPFIVGLVINPDETVDAISQKYDLHKIPLIQIMTVHPGKQGNPFIIKSLNKIDQLKTLGYKDKISLDGSINNVTIEEVKQHQTLPDTVCVGSYFTRCQNEEELKTHIEKLKNATQILLG